MTGSAGADATARPSRRACTQGAVSPQDRRAIASSRWMTALVVCVALSSILPNAVNHLYLPHLSLDVSDVVARHPYATLAAAATTMVLCAVSLVVIARGAGRLRGRFSTLAMFVAFPALVVLSSWARLGVQPSRAIDLVVTLLVLWALWTGPVERRLLGVVAVIGSTVAVYSMVLALVRPSAAFFGTQTGQLGLSTKAVIGNDQLAGPFGHSNTLGIAMALCLPLMAYHRRPWSRAAGFAAVSLTLLWTASRTSMISVGIVLVGVVLVTVATGFTRRAVATVLVCSGWVAVVLLPLVVTDLDAFTSRGAIWQGSLDAWHLNPLLGQGFDWYSAVGDLRNDLGRQASSGHNLLIHWLATGGVVAALLGGAVAVRLSRVSMRASTVGSSVVLLWYTATFAWLSTLEAIWEMTAGSELYVFIGFTMALLVRVHERPAAEVTGRDDDSSHQRPRRGTEAGTRLSPTPPRSARPLAVPVGARPR